MPKVKGQKKERAALKDARQLLKLSRIRTQGEESASGTDSVWKVASPSAWNGSGVGTGTTAPASDSLLVSNSESVLVKSLYLYGGGQDNNRVIVVYWHNIPVAPDASGTLPTIDELLVAGGTEITRTYLNTRVKHTVLFDKCYESTQLTVKEVIPVNKRVCFVEVPTAAQFGGHYDSTTDVGRVSKGLICVYYCGAGTWQSQLVYYG